VKILIVRVSSLGDVVHNMPMVADILRHYPDAQIDWVVEEAYVNLVRLNKGVRHVIPYALRRWRKSLFAPATRAEMGEFHRRVREEAYDVVFDTQGLLKTGIVMRMARVVPNGQRVGLANGTVGSGYEGASRLFHTRSVPVDVHTHAVLRGRLVAAEGLGYRVDTPADFMLESPQFDMLPAWLPDRPYAAFFHGTARASKQWAPDNWAQVSRLLAERNLPVLLAWGNDAEHEAAKALATQMPDAQVLPKLSMMEAVLFAQRAALAIGVDTGLTHIAAAYNRPTIELYCDSPRWKTEGNWSSNIINLGDQGTPPSVSDVSTAITSLLGRANARR
jgi:heptosyltransferase-1